MKKLEAISRLCWIIINGKGSFTTQEIDFAKECLGKIEAAKEDAEEPLDEFSTWHADEDEDTVRFHRGNYQVFKSPKHGTDYAEYWPGTKTIQWMLDALNKYEKSHPLPHSVNE